jgi:hypothetical protein
MLKSILNVKGVATIEKEQQKGIHGGRLLQIHQECTVNTQGEICGPPHCPGRCGMWNGEPYCYSF